MMSSLDLHLPASHFSIKGTLRSASKPPTSSPENPCPSPSPWLSICSWSPKSVAASDEVSVTYGEAPTLPIIYSLYLYFAHLPEPLNLSNPQPELTNGDEYIQPETPANSSGSHGFPRTNWSSTTTSPSSPRPRGVFHRPPFLLGGARPTGPPSPVSILSSVSQFVDRSMCPVKKNEQVSTNHDLNIAAS